MPPIPGQTREFSQLSHQVIRCAIEVHRELGPGLLESTYRDCLAKELELSGISCQAELALPVKYKGLLVNCGYRVDLIIENEILLELKAVAELAPIHEAQLLTYMRLSGIRHGFLINFNVKRLKDGLRSFVL
jgi:GxxExxY protein